MVLLFRGSVVLRTTRPKQRGTRGVRLAPICTVIFELMTSHHDSLRDCRTLAMGLLRLVCIAASTSVAAALTAPAWTRAPATPAIDTKVSWNVGVQGDAPLPKPFGRESVIAAVESLKRGGVICVTDDEDRENEGDLIMAGEHATAESVGFIVRYSSGVICCSVPGDRIEELKFPPMYVNNEDPKGTAFTVSTDVKAYGGHTTTTGISAADRAATFRALADPTAGPETFLRPGHVFPLRACARTRPDGPPARAPARPRARAPAHCCWSHLY